MCNDVLCLFRGHTHTCVAHSIFQLLEVLCNILWSHKVSFSGSIRDTELVDLFPFQYENYTSFTSTVCIDSLNLFFQLPSLALLEWQSECPWVSSTHCLMDVNLQELRWTSVSSAVQVSVTSTLIWRYWLSTSSNYVLSLLPCPFHPWSSWVSLTVGPFSSK